MSSLAQSILFRTILLCILCVSALLCWNAMATNQIFAYDCHGEPTTCLVSSVSDITNTNQDIYKNIVFFVMLFAAPLALVTLHLTQKGILRTRSRDVDRDPLLAAFRSGRIHPKIYA